MPDSFFQLMRNYKQCVILNIRVFKHMYFYKLMSGNNWMSGVYYKSQDQHHPTQMRAALPQAGGGWASAAALLQSLTNVK